MTAMNSLRQSQGLTINEFAAVLGVSRSLVTKLLYRQRKPSVDVLKRLQRAFPEIDIGDYLNG